LAVLLLAFLAGCLKCESEISRANVRSRRLLDDLFLISTSLSFVMPGLDPGIHDETQRAIALQESPPLTHRVMDCRVKPGNDER